jgi:hypothetical protein
MIGSRLRYDAADEKKVAKAHAAVAMDAEQIADAVVVAKPKAKKIPAKLNLVKGCELLTLHRLQPIRSQPS